MNKLRRRSVRKRKGKKLLPLSADLQNKQKPSKPVSYSGKKEGKGKASNSQPVPNQPPLSRFEQARKTGTSQISGW